MTDLLINEKLLKDIDLIILDKDGTIIDAHFYWASMIRLRGDAVLRHLKVSPSAKANVFNSFISSLGVDDSGYRLKPQGPVGIKPRDFIIDTAVENLKSLQYNISREEIVEIFLTVDRESKTNLLPLLKLLPGVETFLKAAHTNNIKLAIATTDISTRAQAALEALKLDNLFSFIAGADSIENAKPSPEIAFLILNKLDISPEKTVMIGDHSVDLQMATNSKLKAGIGVATGMLTREELSIDTDYLINSFLELTTTI